MTYPHYSEYLKYLYLSIPITWNEVCRSCQCDRCQNIKNSTKKKKRRFTENDDVTYICLMKNNTLYGRQMRWGWRNLSQVAASWTFNSIPADEHCSRVMGHGHWTWGIYTRSIFAVPRKSCRYSHLCKVRLRTSLIALGFRVAWLIRFWTL